MGEILLWMISLSIFLGSGMEALFILTVMSALALLSAVTVVLLKTSPVAAAALGLALQALLVLYGLVMVFVFLSLIGLADIAVAIVGGVFIALTVSARGSR